MISKSVYFATLFLFLLLCSYFIAATAYLGLRLLGYYSCLGALWPLFGRYCCLVVALFCYCFLLLLLPCLAAAAAATWFLPRLRRLSWYRILNFPRISYIRNLQNPEFAGFPSYTKARKPPGFSCFRTAQRIPYKPPKSQEILGFVLKFCLLLKSGLPHACQRSQNPGIFVVWYW